MSMTMTEAIKEAYTYVNPSISLYDTFEIYHSSWEPVNYIRMVDSDVYLDTPQGRFKPFLFETALPETQSSVRGQMQLTLSCLPVEYQERLYSASLLVDPIFVLYRQYTGENVEPAVSLPVALSVSTIEFNGDFETIITCVYPDLVNIPFCRKAMTAAIFPGGRI